MIFASYYRSCGNFNTNSKESTAIPTLLEVAMSSRVSKGLAYDRPLRESQYDIQQMDVYRMLEDSEEPVYSTPIGIELKTKSLQRVRQQILGVQLKF